MFRNENDLLKSLRKAVMNYDWFDNSIDEYVKPLNKNELKELESYRDTDGLLNFTKIKDMDLLARLVKNVERKNTIEEMELTKTNPFNVENKGSMQDYVASLVDELLPLIGLKEAHVSVDTPAGKATIDVKHGEEPKVVYEVADDDCKESKLTYTVKDENDVEDKIEVTTENEITPTEFESLPFEVEPLEDENFDDELVLDDDPLDFDDCECLSDGRVVKVFDCSSKTGNPQYYHAVKHICEVEHFPTSDVYGYYDEDAPMDFDCAVVIPNVWDKLTSSDIEVFSDMVGSDSKITVYVIDPEDFSLREIETVFDLFEYEMTPQQEEVMFRHE